MAGLLLLYAGGLRQHLPYAQESDEHIIVSTAANIAGSGDLNPGNFSWPASTSIYPLALGYRALGLTDVQTDGLMLVDPRRVRTILPARVMSVGFAFGLAIVLYLAARRLFDRGVALAAAVFGGATPLLAGYAQLARPDTAAAFFAAGFLLAVVRANERPTMQRYAVAGALLGLGVATRYFVVMLAPLVAVAALTTTLSWRRRAALVGLAAVASFAVFAAATPYFFLDFDQAWRNLRTEARDTHPGADGLSRPENLWWYLTVAVPGDLGWPLAIVAYAGCVGLLVRGPWPRRLPVLGAGLFLLGTSLSALHWARWVIPVLPWFGLTAAWAVVAAARGLAPYLPLRGAQVAIVAVLVLAAWPAGNAVLQDVRNARASTRVQAREWMIDNLPPGTSIVQEWYGATLAGTDFDDHAVFSVMFPEAEQYAPEYQVVVSTQYDRFYAEPERYAVQVAAYDRLFATGDLVVEFEPSLVRGGPVIRVYRTASD